jgi:hypothetical protein
MESLNKLEFAMTAIAQADQELHDYVRSNEAHETWGTLDAEQTLSNLMATWSRESMLEGQLLELDIIADEYDDYRPEVYNIETGEAEELDDEIIVGTFEGFHIYRAPSEGESVEDELGSLMIGIVVKPFDNFPGEDPTSVVYRIPKETICEASFLKRDHPLLMDEFLFDEQKMLMSMANRSEGDEWLGDGTDALVEQRSRMSQLIGRRMMLLVERDIEIMAINDEDDQPGIMDIPVLERVQATLQKYEWDIADDPSKGAELVGVFDVHYTPEKSSTEKIPLSKIYAGTPIDQQDDEKDQKLINSTRELFERLLAERISHNPFDLEAAVEASIEIRDALNDGAEALLGQQLTIQTAPDGEFLMSDALVQFVPDGSYLMSDVIDVDEIGYDNCLNTLCFGEWFSFEGRLLGYVFDYLSVASGDRVSEDDFDLKAVFLSSGGPLDYFEGNVVIVSLRDIANSRLSRTNYN